MLTDDEVAAFVRDGFAHLPGAFGADVAERCRAELWGEVERVAGLDRDDPATWTEAVVRLDGLGTPPFRAAANTPALHTAFDRLAGPGRWVRRDSLGTVPVRFASDHAPGDDGWHVEASFVGPDGGPRLNLRSCGRALLLLFLFSDVGPDDAPTRVRVGSHRDVPPLLAGAGDPGREWMALCSEAAAASAARPEVLATGAAGDVYLCHPFLVHAAQPHRGVPGSAPRFMAQPPLQPTGPLDLEAADPTPVERCVRDGLRSHR